LKSIIPWACCPTAFTRARWRPRGPGARRQRRRATIAYGDVRYRFSHASRRGFLLVRRVHHGFDDGTRRGLKEPLGRGVPTVATGLMGLRRLNTAEYSRFTGIGSVSNRVFRDVAWTEPVPRPRTLSLLFVFCRWCARGARPSRSSTRRRSGAKHVTFQASMANTPRAAKFQQSTNTFSYCVRGRADWSLISSVVTSSLASLRWRIGAGPAPGKTDMTASIPTNSIICKIAIFLSMLGVEDGDSANRRAAFVIHHTRVPAESREAWGDVPVVDPFVLLHSGPKAFGF